MPESQRKMWRAPKLKTGISAQEVGYVDDVSSPSNQLKKAPLMTALVPFVLVFMSFTFT
jgi:hypothetical protein